MAPVYSVKVPEYTVDSRPDYEKIGSKIDIVVKKHFLGRKVAIRCLSSQEHKGKTVNDLVKIIRKIGTDRYDQKRSGEKYENVDNKQIDFFALDFTIKEKGEYMRQFIESFYTYPIQDGKKPVRIDVAILYDRAKLRRVTHRYEGRIDIKKDGFVFKDPKNKPAALLGIIKIL
jgi:hypothetical protein